MIQGIAHLAFDVADMEKSLHFYCGILGFTRAFDIPDDQGRPWIEYIKVRDGQFIELFYGGRNKPERVQQPIGFSHLCLEVRDIHEIAEHLRKHGVPLDVEPVQGKDHNWQCWAKDPDGNRIEFMQLDPKSPQMNC
ncbi:MULTISPECIES: VOC family protein [Paenibacillus]|uniref:Glyoxalase/bleomycin resistance protein/dioxygenase n=2 Tax=Paenibacillus lactis TaxID=228574 RepID=G4HHC3_9BACL|nr:VOC family protein [Paenibacillus lactis]EHB63499.1 Glyoxalase/bleomycin resistance protein/dioxygenase [Paenibacillus lactis 154]MBP1891780.1 lactoylglutathione lyase [Paenibacillus lactis]MCM3494238.1 VOC family protein [Paenibacillus lactis]GIO89022.1 lactoylglutathione lyase [Paenibacillus lactis]HAF99228.1 VOC family protein [Paenibacillus lactis]